MYLVLILLALWCGYTLISRRKQNGIAHKLPPKYPDALPIIGHTHLLLLWAKDLFTFVKSMSDFCLKSGGVTYGVFGGVIYYGIVDPEDAATVSNALLRRHHFFDFAAPWMGRGLMVGYGEEYKHHRRLLNPAFSLPVVNGFLGVFNEQSRKMVEELDTYVGKGPFDHILIFKTMVFRTSCMTAMGENEMMDADLMRQYIATTDKLLESMMQRLRMFWLHNDIIFRFSSLKRNQDKWIKFMNEITYEVIARKKIELQHRANAGYIAETDGDFKTFLEMMLETTNEPGGFAENEIRDELNSILATSYETTSQQLIFIATLLGSFPEIQEKLYNEVTEVVGERDVEKQDLSKLVYTEAVIKESLRFMDTVPLVPRYVDRDLKLKNYTLRAGSNVFFMTRGIHRSLAWGSDINDFKPERWLDKEMQPKFASMFFAFGFGYRSCVGRRYAITSMKVALAHIIRQFRWTADYTKMKYQIDAVMRSESGHEITLERRDSKYDSNGNLR